MNGDEPGQVPPTETSQHGRVAVVHSFYAGQEPSGENIAVLRQVDALRRSGHEVALIDQRTDDRTKATLYEAEAALTVATGHGRSPLRELRRFQPDIVHVHNLFPNFGRTWVRHWHGPLVASMHNYRPMCPAGTFYRDNEVCTDCLDARSPRPSIRYSCYRGSRVQTLPLAMSTRFDADPVLARADAVTVLGDEMGDLYDRAGVSRNRMHVLRNFVPNAAVGPSATGGTYWLYVGRLSPEKGILEAVRGWPAGHRLVVAGTGPLEREVRAAGGSDVAVFGKQSPEQVQSLMAGAIGLIFPSRWKEDLALVCLESLAVGTPILSWPEIPAATSVRRLGVGIVVDRDLASVLSEAWTVFPSLRGRCQDVFTREFSEAAWLQSVGEVYDDAIRTRRSRRRHAALGR